MKKGKRKCIRCGSTNKKDVTWGPDPYDEDVNNDNTPVKNYGTFTVQRIHLLKSPIRLSP